MARKKRSSSGVFETTWKVLAAKGICDAFGGCEYQRVKNEFNHDQAIRIVVMNFIADRANIGPAGTYNGPKPN